MVLTLHGLPTSLQTGNRKKETDWNLARKDGWKRYEVITKANSDKIKQVLNNEELDIEEVMEKVKRIENKIKFESFGKTTRNQKVTSKVVSRFRLRSNEEDI